MIQLCAKFGSIWYNKANESTPEPSLGVCSSSVEFLISHALGVTNPSRMAGDGISYRNYFSLGPETSGEVQ
jgi:hypothetical protein